MYNCKQKQPSHFHFIYSQQPKQLIKATPSPQRLLNSPKVTNSPKKMNSVTPYPSILPNLKILLPTTLAAMHPLSQPPSQLHYLMNFTIFSQHDVSLFCAYKQFIESTIIQLGEDWIIESRLLTQDILASLGSETVQAQAEPSNFQRCEFNIFNQFLQPFLKNKIGHEAAICAMSDVAVQEKFAQDLSEQFLVEQNNKEKYAKIASSLTFKTLSLGFCIIAFDMWQSNFSGIESADVVEVSLTPLGVLQKQKEKKNIVKVVEKSTLGTSTIRNNLSNMDLSSYQHSASEVQDRKSKFNTQSNNEKKWNVMDNLQIFSSEQVKGIYHTLKKAKAGKIHVIAGCAVTIHQMSPNGKKIRVLSTSHQFYRLAFVVWLLFNIKLFFTISFEQYLIHFKNLIEKWDENLELPLKKFYIIIQKQWNTLLKDYSVALHDDIEVLKCLIKRVKSTYEQIWKNKHEEIFKKISESC